MNMTFGWSFSCGGIFTGIAQGAGQQTTYYTRCIDTAGNQMQQGYPIVLKGSNQLKIAQSGPSGTIYNNNVTLSVATSEGAESGKARCSYKDQNYGFGLLEFFNTGGVMHTQTLTELLRGQYKYYIECEDVAGNNANTLIGFDVDVDTIAPKILQVYSSGELIYVITDENQIKIITAWRYPGKSPKRNPIPSEILEEARSVLRG